MWFRRPGRSRTWPIRLVLLTVASGVGSFGWADSQSSSTTASAPRAPKGFLGAIFPDLELPSWWPHLVSAQSTFIPQHLFPFHSPYVGPHSLLPDEATNASSNSGFYLGAKLTDNLQGYFDVEMFWGSGLSNANGLGGLTNGDVLRSGGGFGLNHPHDPYIARGYVRYLLPLSDKREYVEEDQDQVGTYEPTHRLEFKLGKFSANDDFDRNRYANTARAQFMNWSLVTNTSWDFAADTQGFTLGTVIGWVEPEWDLKVGLFQEPRVANGYQLDNDVLRDRGNNMQFSYHPDGQDGANYRLLAFINTARMGRYNAAVADAAATGGVPNIVADDHPGRMKYGFAFNMDYPLADGGETGVFARWGWNDGRTESFAYSEVDRLYSFGGQLSGIRWGRRYDVAALGFVIDELSPQHARYLGAGGLGFVLGDGRLNYAPEMVTEVYYRAQLGSFFQISPGLQFIANPGYNQDRGPVWVASLRVRVAYEGESGPGYFGGGFQGF